MKIPTSIRVGRKRYAVKVEKFSPDWKRGTWNWYSNGEGVIRIQPNRDAKQKHETFLHELLHAALWDLKYYELCRNEKFVTALANKINNSLHSADYEQK